MLTDGDVKKLKEVLATKEDLDTLNTKVDKGFVNVNTRIDNTNARIDATNVKIDKGFTDVHSRIDATNVRMEQGFAEIRGDIASLREQIQSLTVSVDKFVKTIEEIRIEQASSIDAHRRYEWWFKKIAEKVGIALEE